MYLVSVFVLFFWRMDRIYSVWGHPVERMGANRSVWGHRLERMGVIRSVWWDLATGMRLRGVARCGALALLGLGVIGPDWLWLVAGMCLAGWGVGNEKMAG